MDRGGIEWPVQYSSQVFICRSGKKYNILIFSKAAGLFPDLPVGVTFPPAGHWLGVTLGLFIAGVVIDYKDKITITALPDARTILQ